VELGFLEEILDELGYSTQLVEKSAGLPYHTLLVALEPDAQERPRQLALNYYPVDEDQVEYSLLLQYYIALPITFDEAGLGRVRAWLPEINNQMVLGHFGITDEQKQVHYRYVQALPRDEVVTTEAVADVLTLVTYSPVLFASALEDLAAGKLTIEQARKQVKKTIGQ
jgi:hypothetical protein